MDKDYLKFYGLASFLMIIFWVPLFFMDHPEQVLPLSVLNTIMIGRDINDIRKLNKYKKVKT